MAQNSSGRCPINDPVVFFSSFGLMSSTAQLFVPSAMGLFIIAAAVPGVFVLYQVIAAISRAGGPDRLLHQVGSSNHLLLAATASKTHCDILVRPSCAVPSAGSAVSSCQT